MTMGFPTRGSLGNPLARQTTVTTASNVWVPVGAPLNISSAGANYIGFARDNFAVDRSTNQVMLLEANGAGTSVTATIYQISTAGISTVATGSTTNNTWLGTAQAQNASLRRVVGAKGVFFCGQSGFRATASGGTITFGTTTLSAPSNTPIAGGGTLGSVQTYQNGTIAASSDGRVFGYFAGTRAPVCEIDPLTGSVLLASSNAPNSLGSVNSAIIHKNRYLLISDLDASNVGGVVASLDLLSHNQYTIVKEGGPQAVSNSDGRCFHFDPVSDDIIQLQGALGYATNGNGILYTGVQYNKPYGYWFFDSSTSYAINTPTFWLGNPTNYLIMGDMLFEASGVTTSPSMLTEVRSLVGKMPPQTPSRLTGPFISFSVGGNLAVVIHNGSMQAYAR